MNNKTLWYRNYFWQVSKTLMLFVVISILFFTDAAAQVRLPKLVSDGMVLQREVKNKIWGWASPKEKIAVLFNKKNYKTKADANGNWQVFLPAVKAGGAYTITIKGKNTITVNDVLFGDVWFCSGQSNMVHQMNIHDVQYATEIATANYSQIRNFTVPNHPQLVKPITDFESGKWIKAVGEEIRPFSVVAYFFAKEMYQKYGVPIGIINASAGGSPIDAWLSEETLLPFPEIFTAVQKNKDTAAINEINRKAAAVTVVSQDKGMKESPKWFEENYLPNGWRNINVPGYWEDQGMSDLNGVVWYRKEVNIPAAMVGKNTTVFLGRIVDVDELYINGKRVGQTYYQYPQRRYKVDANILKPGKNTFTVRVTNHSGKGGFIPDKQYYIFSGSDTVDLKGTWQYKVGEVFVPNANALPTINIQNQPTALYNGMVAPLHNYNFKGAIWYQGESDTHRVAAYAKLQEALIAQTRKNWNNDTLPFLLVQLPNFMDYKYVPVESNWAAFREVQRNMLQIPHTALAVTIDVGEWNDIHPGNKHIIGERLALAAKKLVFKEKIVSSGPTYQSYKKEGNKIVLSFTNTGSGLVTNNNEPLTEFAIAGADKKFVWATAKIEGDKIIVWSDEVSNPKYIRYAWADNPVNPNLYNKEGLPASPFQIILD